MAARKCTIRYGTSLTPSFAKLIDIVPPTSQDFENSQLSPKNEKRVESEGPKLKRPSLSAILGSIDDKKALYLWQKKMIDEMGLAGFRSMMTERMTLGTKTHSKIENLVKIRTKNSDFAQKIRQEIDAEKNVAIANFMRSAVPIIEDIEESENVITEKSVKHPLLGYQGRFDAILPYRGNLAIVDWKTAPARSSFSQQKEESLSYVTYARQLAAYASAFNYDSRFSNFPFIRQGLLVSLKEDGQPADVYEIKEDELKNHLEEVKSRLKLFWNQIETSKSENIDFAYSE